MAKETSKPLFNLPAQANAPFLALFSMPGLWQSIWVDVHRDKIVLRWGFFRKREKEIPFSEIISFKLDHLGEFPYKLSLSEWNTKIDFKDNGYAVRLELLPTKSSLLEFPDLVKHLRKNIPGKEEKQKTSASE